MLLGIDHLVIAVRSPDAAAEVMERDLGLAVTGGGRHEAMGTYNRLAFLGDTYIELIGVFDAGLVRSSRVFAVGNAALAHLEARGEGLATYALASDDVRGDVVRLRAAGSPIGEPVAGQRVRPDGEAVRWVTAFPELGANRAPFLIEHAMAGAEWGPEARAARAAFRHPGGGRVRMAGVELPAGGAGETGAAGAAGAAAGAAAGGAGAAGAAAGAAAGGAGAAGAAAGAAAGGAGAAGAAAGAAGAAGAAAVARDYGTVLGVAFSEGWRTAVGEQQIVLREDGGTPVVTLHGETGTEPLELARFGVLWRRVPWSDLP